MKAILAMTAGLLTASAVAMSRTGVREEKPPQAAPARTESASGAPKIAHLAWCPAGFMHLDGPRLEAMSPDRPGAGLSDDAGNVFFGTRCLERRSGIVKTIGDDYWQSEFGAAEGPVSAFSTYEPYQADYATFSRFVGGSPLEGGEQGCLYFADFDSGEVKKMWKNPDQGGRWWFRKIAGGGKKPLPRSKGETVPALEVEFSGNMMLQVMPDNRLIIFSSGVFCEYRDGNLVCLLGPDDHKTGQPRLGLIGGDGTFYLGYYWGGGEKGGPSVIRVTPQDKAEPYINGQFNNPRDGSGMHTGYFCGPHFWAFMHNYKFIPKDILLLCAHDDDLLRRARGGRVASLCPDGEWRELDKGQARKESLRWFRWLRGNMCPAPGPNGTCVTVCSAISDNIIFEVTGIDYNKPTVGPQLADPPPGASDKAGNDGGAEGKEGE